MSKAMMQAGDFCWNELTTPDPKKAKDFYCSLLGWESQEHDMGTMSYTMFKNGDKEIAGMMQTPKGQEKEIPPHWMGYILVEDLDAMITKAKSLGATIVMPATPVADFGRFTVLKDPTGAHISLWQSTREK